MERISKLMLEQIKDFVPNFSSLESLTDKQKMNINKLSLSKNDLKYLPYFNYLEELDLNAFPSINQDDITLISKCKTLKKVVIQEQNAIFSLDMSSLDFIDELFLIHNDNLVNVIIPSNLSSFVFYDNKDFRDVFQIIDIIVKNKNCHFTIDIIYCFEIVRTLLNMSDCKDVLKNITWVESVGLRNFKTYEYTTDEIKYLIDYVSYVVSKYIFTTDEDYEKFGILYKWMIDNIHFVNEDDNKNYDRESNNILEVFKYKVGGRLTFAKAFQFMLSFVDIKSSIVYSLGALDNIGYYNGEQVYSLLGISDYALLRVYLDGKYYYTDIAWDSMVNNYKYFDVLRLFLVSREELKLRHKLVGEANIDKTYSYHGDDSEELIAFAADRIKEVNEILDDIDRENINIDSMLINCKLLYNDLGKFENQLFNIDKNSRKYYDLKRNIEKINKDINIAEADYRRFLKLRENIIKSYTGYLLNHYIGTSSLDNKDTIKEIIRVKKNNFVISEYMFNLLNECID